jgi:hypothetical protein
MLQFQDQNQLIATVEQIFPDPVKHCLRIGFLNYPAFSVCAMILKLNAEHISGEGFR